MKKERLEEMKERYNNPLKLANIPFGHKDKPPFKFVLEEDLEWLIEQAEMREIHSKKLDELHVFLQNNVDILANEKWGHHVIDAAMHAIEKQAERIQYLENTLDQDARQEVLEGLYEENNNLKAIKAGNEELIKMLEGQNDRYREVIEKAISHFNQDEHQEGMSVLKNVLRGESR